MPISFSLLVQEARRRAVGSSLLATALCLLASGVPAAVVGPAGYTNDFAVQPAAADWATATRAGGGADAYVMDTDVNANITAAGVTAQTAGNVNNPATQLATASWSSSGLYVQTRPTGNRYTALMAKFVNNSGTNASQIALSYAFTMAGTLANEDGGLGTRAYFSLSGALNSWTNLPTLNSLANSGSFLLATNLSLDWTNGGSLYVLWADDNAGVGTDVADEIDNFSLRVTAGLPPVLTVIVSTPGSNALFVSSAPITAAATPIYGTPPYTVEYFTNSGAENVDFVSAGSSGSPYTLALGALDAATYNLYAVVTDSTSATSNSRTNTFLVADPITATLTSPADGASFDDATSVTGAITVSGGTAPYAVQFLLDNTPSGAAVTTPPYERNFGALFVGNHTIKAVVTDAKGWVSNSAVSTVHITGPLGVVLVPTNGASYLYGEPVILTAAPGGGTAPYSVSFFTNDQPVSTLAAAPFMTNLGLLAVGSYTAYAHVTDGSAPTPQQNSSTTNTFAVLPNPLLVSLTNPTNGQGAVVGVPVTLTAVASVTAPLAVASVEFFLDGVSTGVDASAPFSAVVTSPEAGARAVHAVATDTLGRASFSETNVVTFIVDPLVNNNFANRLTLTTPASLSGNNTGAGTEGGEPTSFFGGGTFLQWGATLWYQWVAPFSGTVTIHTLGSGFNTVLSVYTGPAVNGLTLVQRNDDYSGTDSLVSFAVTAGTEYQIQVGGFRPFGGGTIAQTGAFQLTLSMPPAVAITAPANNSVFLTGSNITVDVTATPASGIITNVSLYIGSSTFTLVGTFTSSPGTFVVSNAPAGTNLLIAVAYDSLGQGAASTPVTIAVFNPGLTLTAPQDGATFLATNPITLGAHAMLDAGAMTNVEFYVDGVKVGEDATAPFSVVWSRVTGGSHRLTAVGWADTGASHNSQTAFIAVGQTLVASNSVWKFKDDGTDQGTNWIMSGFDDSTWASGPAPLGYSDSNGRLVLTTNSFGADVNNKFATTYYRRSFTVGAIATLTNVILNLQRDDGVIVYLNGVEVSRLNMPVGPVSQTTFSSATANDDGATTFTIHLSPALLVEGANVLAVEIHQESGSSSDIWFVMDVTAVPRIIRNQPPVVSIYDPTNAYFLGLNILHLNATATDADGSVTNVEFYDNGVKIGEQSEAAPGYSFAWNNPPIGTHSITAVAIDNQGGRGTSPAVTNIIYDAAGRPFTRITSPAHGAIMEGPTNLLITAAAYAIDGVTNVEFFANGVSFGSDATAPYSTVWTSEFLTNQLFVVATDSTGLAGTSSVVTVVIAIPPTNIVEPYILAQTPTAFTDITNLTAITVVFSEPVQNVDAGDLLVNGIPAAGLIGGAGSSNYTFTFPHPPYGEVEVVFAAGHGITDYGWPYLLLFNELDPSAAWEYELDDHTRPILAARTPAPGSTVTNLAAITVSFSEAVTGVDPADLLVAGTAAFAAGSADGTNYTFNVSQPNSGTIAVTWATNHGILDTAANAFVAANWSFTLDARTVLVPSNSVWRYLGGLTEASVPSSTWRFPGEYSDEDWPAAPAPFFYGDPYTNLAAGITGTLLSNMRSNYSCIFLRKEFTVANLSALNSLFINAQSDDGFIAWINGVEVLRYNMPAGEPANTSIASGPSPEPANTGAAYIPYAITNTSMLVNGVNLLAVQAFNETLGGSSDFGFNAQVYAYLSDTALTAPRIASNAPPPGDVFSLSNLTVIFNEGVANVNTGDLLVNGVAATGLVSVNNTTYTFAFAQPTWGAVTVSWITNHGIVDFDSPAKPFDGAVANSILHYTLVNPSAPTVLSKTPAASTTVTGLTSITVVFSEEVAGVEETDLLINGVPAGDYSGSGDTYTFVFGQPAFGPVAVTWATNHGIQDVQSPANDFEPSRPGHTWSYSLVNPVPSVAITTPTNNSYSLVSAALTLRADASDNDGTVALVEYFEGVNKIADATNSPYTFPWSGMPEGAYTLRAVATDNSGLRGTSAPVVVNIVTNLPAVLVRGPYLQSGSSTGGVVRWRTDVVSDAVVSYGTDPMNLTHSALQTAQTTEHIVQLGGLQPDTKYYYAFGSSSHTLAGGTNAGGSNYWFITSPVAGTRKPTRIWALGDSGTGTANQRAVRDAYYNHTATNRPADLWMMLGDNAYNSGTDAEHQTAVFDMYPATLRNYFLWPTIGNHETAQSTTANSFPYLDIFSLPENGEAGGVPSGTEKYYSFDYANLHIVCLDSMTSGRTATSAMAQWLTNDLASTAQEWTIVFFHHPPYTKGSHNSDAESDLIAIRQNIVPLLEAAHVDLVLSGHSHCYERSFLIHTNYGLSTTFTAAHKINGGDGRLDGNGAYSKNPQGEGVVYSVAGSSGQISGGTLNHPAHHTSLNELGSVIIDVSSNRLDMMFLNSAGASRDHFTLIKTVPTAPASLAARGVSSSRIDLDWADNATNEISYLVERSLDGVNFTFALSAPANATNASDTGLLADTGYHYRVRAVNGMGASEFSSIASASTTNGAPVIAAIPDAVVEVNQSFAFTNQVSDPDGGGQVTWSLDPGFPAGARIDTGSGVFRWTPTRTQMPGTHSITVRVTDNGVPPLSASQIFTLIVKDLVEFSVGAQAVRAGGHTSVTVTAFSSALLTNFSMTVRLSAERLTDLTVENLALPLGGVTLDTNVPGSALVTFSALPGQVLLGTQEVARLHFTAAPGQSTAFLPLHLTDALVARADPGLPPTVLLNDGRVVVIGDRVLLEAQAGTNGTGLLTFYGVPGVPYAIETSPDATAWSTWLPFTPTNLVERIPLPAPAGPVIFYRARE